MAIDWLARMRFMFNKAAARIDSRLNLDDIDRYWNYPRAGDPFLEAYQESRRLTGSSDDLAKQMRFHTLMQAVSRVASGRVAGDVAECGCWRGHSSHMIARALSASEWAGRLLIFDSFEGGFPTRACRTARSWVIPTPMKRLGRSRCSHPTRRRWPQSSAPSTSSSCTRAGFPRFSPR
ncbi:TylF/MycF/NovP-related O-methyltransferase [Pseudomonas sp. BLCC-B13]|uniref:TylF/MycF/NovP-related O-methyltransferase n=1 Tax=Pseudomonas sp. BLCC-B13 TaxID=3025314 RepID=UPI003FA7C340